MTALEERARMLASKIAVAERAGVLDGREDPIAEIVAAAGRVPMSESLADRLRHFPNDVLRDLAVWAGHVWWSGQSTRWRARRG